MERLERVFETLDEKRDPAQCAVMTAIIESARAVAKNDFADAALDASLIAMAELAEHYEIVAYGSLRLWAKAMGLTEEADLLLTIDARLAEHMFGFPNKFQFFLINQSL